MPFSNREDQLAYQRGWDKRNAEKKLRQKSARRKEFKRRFLEFKRTLRCVRCGESHPATLDFHHIDPSKKDFSLGEIGKADVRWETLMEEVKKCLVLCANCHRKEHYVEVGESPATSTVVDVNCPSSNGQESRPISDE